MINSLRHPFRFLSKAVLTLNLVLWLLRLPVMLRIRTIPLLLKNLGRSENYKRNVLIELQDAVEIVTRICGLSVFRARVFPKLCLRQSLTLYRTLSRMGYPVQIHFGVINDANGFQGHSWVTVEGKAVADTARSEIFKAVYSYSSAYSLPASSDRSEIKRSTKDPHV
jgi:Transglutaminase-like superfamily